MLDFLKEVQNYNYYVNNESDMERKTKKAAPSGGEFPFF